MSNLNHFNPNQSSKKTINSLSRKSNKKTSSNTKKIPLRLESEKPSRLESEQPSRLKSIPPSRSESEMLFLTESSKHKTESSKHKTESGNQFLFDNSDNILYPGNNNRLNNITDIDYNSNNNELSNISIQLVNECINWASQYHLETPYLYELSIKKKHVYNNTIKSIVNVINFDLYKGSIYDIYVRRANKFNITVLIIIMYTIYLLKNDINNNAVFSSLLDYVNDIQYQNEIAQLINVNSYKLSDEYKLYFYNSFIKKSLYAYKTANEFYDLGGHAYITALHGGLLTDSNTYELFFKVPKNVKIGFLVPLDTYGMATINNRNIYYLSRDIGLKNILTLGPNYYQNINNNIPSELINMNIYHEGQLVPNLMLSFSFNVIISNNDIKSNTEPNNTNKYENYIKYTNKLKLHDDKHIHLHDITHYIYNKLIRYFIRSEINKKYGSNKLHTKDLFTNNGVRYKYIYIKYDKTHYFHNMIIQNISLYHPDIFNEITKYTVSDRIKDIFKDYLNMADKTINILSNFYLNVSLLSNENDIYEYEFILSLPINEYIHIIDNELKNYKKANTVNKNTPGGNLYVFSSCRFYDTIKNEYNNNIYVNSSNITKQLAMTYITDITNKYVSSLVNKTPDKVKYKPFTISKFDHSLNNTMIYNSTLAIIYTNKQYSALTLNLSKDFLILFAISNIIINSKNINIDHTKNSDILRIINIALYNLFIKPRFDVKELTPYTISKLKIYTEKSEPGIKANSTHKKVRKPRSDPKYTNTKKKVLLVNEINSILYSKINPSYGYLKVILNNIVYFLIQYYLPYIKWIYKNYVIYIYYCDYNPIETAELENYPLIYHPINNYFNQSRRKDKIIINGITYYNYYHQPKRKYITKRKPNSKSTTT
jgi:hypothetical protein